MVATIEDLNTFASAEKLTDTLAERISTGLKDAIAAKGQATLVVSGGSTPKPLFQKLSRQNIDWKKVTITLADERWVDTEDSSSNENLVRALLLQNIAAQATFIGLKNQASSAGKGEPEAHAALSRIQRPFDIVILGMGGDGHTASLFPDAARLPEAVDIQTVQNCIALSPPDSSFERMTMTLPALLDSHEIILHITGKNKLDTLKKALGPGNALDMPIRYILRQSQTPVFIYWAP